MAYKQSWMNTKKVKVKAHMNKILFRAITNDWWTLCDRNHSLYVLCHSLTGRGKTERATRTCERVCCGEIFQKVGIENISTHSIFFFHCGNQISSHIFHIAFGSSFVLLLSYFRVFAHHRVFGFTHQFFMAHRLLGIHLDSFVKHLPIIRWDAIVCCITFFQ